MVPSSLRPAWPQHRASVVASRSAVVRGTQAVGLLILKVRHRRWKEQIAAPLALPVVCRRATVEAYQYLRVLLRWARQGRLMCGLALGQSAATFVWQLETARQCRAVPSPCRAGPARVAPVDLCRFPRPMAARMALPVARFSSHRETRVVIFLVR